MKTLALCTSAVVVLAASTALAESALPSKLHDIPEAVVPAAPQMDSRPVSIAANSKVEGLTLVAMPPMPVPSGLARFARKGRAASAPVRAEVPPQPQEVQIEGAPDSCLSISSNGRTAFRTAQLFLDPSEGVQPVRLETLKETPAGATLTIVDAWVDPQTTGAEQVAKVEVPLVKVGSGPLGASVYAMRNGDVLTMVMPAGQNAQVSDPSGRTFSSACAVVQAELTAGKGKASTLSGFITRMTPPFDPSRPGLPAVAPTAVRIAFSASLSQTSSDPDAVLSVTMRQLDPIPTAAQRAFQPSLAID